MIGRPPRSTRTTCQVCGRPAECAGFCRRCYNSRRRNRYKHPEDPHRTELLEWYESFCPDHPDTANVLRALWLYRLIAQRITVKTGVACRSEDIMQHVLELRHKTASERN